MFSLIEQHVFPHFNIAQAKITTLGNGLINKTFLIESESEKFVLQQINTKVFSSPDALMKNAEKIAAHLTKKAEESAYSLQVIKPILTSQNTLGVDLAEHGYWRALSYVPNSTSIDIVTHPQEAEKASQAFGLFTNALFDLNAETLVDVIPDFHNLPKRLQALSQAVTQDPCNRLSCCRKWAELALNQSALLAELAQVSADLPLRVCHKDTKLNNMLFDKNTGESLAVIDLDTCMQGHLMYDFGDMVRAFCSAEAEDSIKTDLVHIRPDIFRAVCKGYLSALSSNITFAERESFYLGCKVITLMLGVRFLTDFLMGDCYFQIEYKKHNLDRAINQLTLYQRLQTQESELKPYLFD